MWKSVYVYFPIASRRQNKLNIISDLVGEIFLEIDRAAACSVIKGKQTIVDWKIN